MEASDGERRGRHAARLLYNLPYVLPFAHQSKNDILMVVVGNSNKVAEKVKDWVDGIIQNHNREISEGNFLGKDIAKPLAGTA